MFVFCGLAGGWVLKPVQPVRRKRGALELDQARVCCLAVLGGLFALALAAGLAAALA